MERGYVKLWRKTLDSGLLSNANALQLFMYLLLEATHKTKKHSANGFVVTMNPGDAIFRRGKVSEKLKMSEQSVRTALGFLKKLEIVTTQSTNRFTIVSFVNWDTYQKEQTSNQPASQPTGNQQLTSSQPAANQQLTTKQECKNVRNNNIYTPLVPPQAQSVTEGDERQAHTSQPCHRESSDEPDMTFCELRDFWNAHFRTEGPKTGYVEYKAYISRHKTFPWSAVWHDVTNRQRNGFWNKGYAVSLATYIRDEYWRGEHTNPHRPSQKQQTRAPSGGFDVEEQADICRRIAAKYDNTDYTTYGGEYERQDRSTAQGDGIVRTGNELRQTIPGAAHGFLDASARAV